MARLTLSGTRGRKKIGGGTSIAIGIFWAVSVSLAFSLGTLFSEISSANGSPKTSEGQMSGTDLPSKTALPRKLLDLPQTVKFIYINIGTSWDPWPGCGTKDTNAEMKGGHNHGGSLPYNPEVFCIYVEPLMRVNTALYERGIVTNSSILIHTAIGPNKGLAPFYEYAGVSGVASSLSAVSDEILQKEIDGGSKGPFSSGARGQTFTTVVTLKDLLDIIPDHVRILTMKTDMQGFDVTAIQSAGTDIRRVDEIFHECYGDGEAEQYTGAPIPNTYQAAKALLEPLGFESGRSRRHDCNWRRRGSSRVPGGAYLGVFD